MRIKSFPAVLAAGLLLTACAAPDHQGGEAAPAGSVPAPATSAAPASAAPASASVSATKTSPAGKDPNTLGPTGFGALRLGMTDKDAQATKLLAAAFKPVGEPGGGATCSTSHLKGSSADQGLVYLNSQQGVVAIYANNTAMHTPEGIHLGSPKADVQRAYPEWVPFDNEKDGRGYAKARDNEGNAEYRIVTENGKVISLGLQDVRQGCYE